MPAFPTDQSGSRFRTGKGTVHMLLALIERFFTASVIVWISVMSIELVGFGKQKHPRRFSWRWRVSGRCQDSRRYQPEFGRHRGV
jgi:hypothetical protein